MLADANGQPLVVHAVKAAPRKQSKSWSCSAIWPTRSSRHREGVPSKSRLRFVTNPDFAKASARRCAPASARSSTNVDAAIVQHR
jgi:molybdenum cofactor cytidylyltransferase